MPAPAFFGEVTGPHQHAIGPASLALMAGATPAKLYFVCRLVSQSPTSTTWKLNHTTSSHIAPWQHSVHHVDNNSDCTDCDGIVRRRAASVSKLYQKQTAVRWIRSRVSSAIDTFNSAGSGLKFYRYIKPVTPPIFPIIIQQ